jgi:hypothetical protein
MANRRKSSRGGLCFVLMAFVLGSISRQSLAQSPPPMLNPNTYASPCGKYSLFVNPSDMFGRGKADYKMSLDGREVWSGEKPYTLWDAKVTDDGCVLGYSYSFGKRGLSEAGWKAGPGDFQVVILDPLGRERFEQLAKRERSRFLHDDSANPEAAGLILDSANDRMILRVRDADINRGEESWWTYRISTGKALETFRPKEFMAASNPLMGLTDVKLVSGTPLALLQWRRFDFENERKWGVCFSVVGQDGKPVWTLELPTDHDTGDDEKAEELLKASLNRNGGILKCDEIGRFELRIVKDEQRVTFGVTSDEIGAWVVSEVGRRPFVEPPILPSKAPKIPPLQLRPVGSIVLKSPGTERVSEIRNISEFDIDERGRIAFLRGSETSETTLIVVDQQGSIIHKVSLGLADGEKDEGWATIKSLGPDRYFLLRYDEKGEKRMGGFVVEAAAGTVKPIKDFATTVLSRVAGFPDGGFVIQGGLTYGKNFATGDDEIRSYDVEGKPLWSRPEHGNIQDTTAIYDVADLTATDGKLAILDRSRKLVQFFDREGKHQSTIDLKKAWGREPNYLSEISADRDGGVVIDDFDGKPPIVRMKADGTVRGNVTPQFKSGQKVHFHSVRSAPDGALWTSDGIALYRLTDSGVVDRVLGEPPAPKKLGTIAALTLDGKGKIYAVDERSGAVHVFEADGRWLRVCEPKPGDTPDHLLPLHLTVSDSEDIFLGLGFMNKNRYIHYAPDGHSLDVAPSKLDDLIEVWHAQPKTNRRWVLGYHKVYLIDKDGTIVRTILRRADGRWLGHPGNASVAADGSIAIMSRDDGSNVVTLYSNEGEPVRTFLLPKIGSWSFAHIAYDGKHVVVAGEEDLVFFDLTGKVLGRFNPSPGKKTRWTPFLVPDSRKLLLFDGSKTLQSFELP